METSSQVTNKKSEKTRLNNLWHANASKERSGVEMQFMTSFITGLVHIAMQGNPLLVRTYLSDLRTATMAAYTDTKCNMKTLNSVVKKTEEPLGTHRTKVSGRAGQYKPEASPFKMQRRVHARLAEKRTMIDDTVVFICYQETRKALETAAQNDFNDSDNARVFTVLSEKMELASTMNSYIQFSMKQTRRHFPIIALLCDSKAALDVKEMESAIFAGKHKDASDYATADQRELFQPCREMAKRLAEMIEAHKHSKCDAAVSLQGEM